MSYQPDIIPSSTTGQELQVNFILLPLLRSTGNKITKFVSIFFSF